MVDVVLATHNGGAYIGEQLQSLLQQTEQSWRIFAMDDGSTDNTLEILSGFSHKHPDRMKVIPNEHPAGSAADTFLKLLAASTAPYAMCCDQDDVWHADKIEQTLIKMREMEQAYGKDTPLLAHTDLAVTDEALHVISPSLVRFQALNPRICGFSRLLAQNNVTGCTVMINAALRELLPSASLPGLAMHDWWMALVASAFGNIGYIDAATVSYRQHGKNTVGAKNIRALVWRVMRENNGASIRSRLVMTYKQAEAFESYYAEKLDARRLLLARQFARIPYLGKPRRIARLVWGGYWKHDWKRVLGQIYYI